MRAWPGYSTIEAVDTSGIELARRYYRQVVEPLLRTHCPDLSWSAARLGSGSDVLGLDDARSRDHDWGLRLTLLVDDDAAVTDVRALLEARLPDAFEGLPTRFATSWDPTPTHNVDVRQVDAFIQSRLGVDIEALEDPLAWLALTGQSVLEVVAGPVFCDTSGRLSSVRTRLGWYPDDVWFYALASGWQRLAQELPIVGRCAEVGDDLGSRLIAARLARDVMHLAFLVERAWPPYPKWFGTRFAALQMAAAASPALDRALTADDWRAREEALVAAVEVVADAHAMRGLPLPDPTVVRFWDRPYRTISADVPAALMAAVSDRIVASLPIGVGSIEQWVDNVDVLSVPERRATITRSWHQALRSPP